MHYEKAYYGYSQKGSAFVPYSGNLTRAKEAEIRNKLARNGFMPGWEVKDLTITPPRGGLQPVSYSYDGGSGVGNITVLD